LAGRYALPLLPWFARLALGRQRAVKLMGALFGNLGIIPVGRSAHEGLLVIVSNPGFGVACLKPPAPTRREQPDTTAHGLYRPLTEKPRGDPVIPQGDSPE
jgi:hypothetical protein